MPSLKTILVVDDNSVNRAILSKILSGEYMVLQAENGEVALSLLREHTNEISAVMLDLVMPIMDGYGFLEVISEDEHYKNLPIIVTTENSGSDNEIKALSLGAWDFVSKPYSPLIISFRLKNAIDRSQLFALKQLKYLSEYDALTGIFNKTKFFEAARELINTNSGERFVFLRFDVDRFQLINSFFGTAEGDKLLTYIGNHLKDDAKKFEKVTYGRIESDIFGFFMAYDKDKTEYMIERSKSLLAKYNTNYDIVPSVGVYIIDDNTISVEEMYNRATLAAKKCKGNYVEYYAYYNEAMSIKLNQEQEIVNDMKFALENGQFEIYLQPQYNIHSNLPCGAEALIRWIHPQKGIIFPNEFIPIFESNGFITKLDHYVWEQACKCLRKWIDQGIKPYPISVNISRVNVYNPIFPQTLVEMVKRYNIDPALLNLELTESAYTDNPIAMKKVMTQLQSDGFTIMMDDFGTGYSSLGLLKDIVIDILKIDMRFLSKTEIPGRGENIIASVIRMAKWLNIPVVAEGAETSEQVEFLKSVGCDYVQGYYFARPMPIKEYEDLCINQLFDVQMITDKKSDIYNYDDLFSLNPEMHELFCNSLQATVIYELVDNRIEIIRMNEAYYALLGQKNALVNSADYLSVVDDDYKEILLNAFCTCAKTHESTECEYLRNNMIDTPIWIYIKLNYVFTAGNKHIIIGELTDITIRKAIDCGIQKYKASLIFEDHAVRTVLIVDDASINRIILKKILQDKFCILEAENGEEAIKILQENKNQIDLILLDITMPKMNGKEFLQYKKNLPELDCIPVIMITADDSPDQQISTLSLGANDYMVKPFIPEVVIRRIKNVLESTHRFKSMVKEYNSMSEQVKTDLMTGLFNRTSAEVMIAKSLEGTDESCAMLMLDIDNFKKINDANGHSYGDKVIAAVAEKIRLSFRKEDIIARMGGDEFAIFMCDVADADSVELKAHKVCKGMEDIEIDGKRAAITCSVGIAVLSAKNSLFNEFYQDSDKALYNAKCHGRNTVSVYGKDSQSSLMTKWINDAEGVLDAINDAIYACDKDNYDLLYANDYVCKFAGIAREDCKGKKCYEVLMHKTKPCEFCALKKMSEETVYTRLFNVPNSEQVFLMRGRNINWNGAIIHLEVAVDVTKIENMNLYTEEISRDKG